MIIGCFHLSEKHGSRIRKLYQYILLKIDNFKSEKNIFGKIVHFLILN